jgi:enoyl-CoA hydratase/carnithine racemase
MTLDYVVHDDGVATITLDRPDKHNAFTFAMIDAWADALHDAARNERVRAVVLTATGRSFCSGVDLAELQGVDNTPLARRRMLTDRVHRVAHAVDALDKPLIAAVNGPAVGAGMDMALMCDIRFAGASARFSEGYVRVGLVPGDGGCHYLPRIVGTAKALELLWTGDFVDADEALALGIVTRVHPDAELLDRTLDFARRLAAGPPFALATVKRAVHQGLRANDLRTSLDLIASHFAVVASTTDSAEALTATREKRPPTFTNN